MNVFVKPISLVSTDDLATQWLAAKKEEGTARKKRLEIEEKIILSVGAKEEGVTSLESELFVLKTTGKVTRSLDTATLQKDWLNLPHEVQKCVKWSAALDTSAYRALVSMRDDLTPKLNQYLTSKVAKPAISVSAKNGN